ncbi:MAG: hypothetical protein PS018_15770, partial [bacterium]|nr:hypothetical protein [bacterium]
FCTAPASNKEFWQTKFDETVKRDKRNLAALRKLGWKVAIVWECSVKEQGARTVAGKISSWLKSGRSFKEISSSQANQPRRRASKATNKSRR